MLDTCIDSIESLEMRLCSALLAFLGLSGSGAVAPVISAPPPLNYAAIRFALAQVESGDNPNVLGAAGEIGRYQILPEIARRYGGHDWSAAQRILRDRLERFPRPHPTPEDVYMMWHRPGLYGRMEWRLDRLPGIVRARAERFANLYALYLRELQ